MVRQKKRNGIKLYKQDNFKDYSQYQFYMTFIKKYLYIKLTTKHSVSTFTFCYSLFLTVK